jgi:hypothetical protein
MTQTDLELVLVAAGFLLFGYAIGKDVAENKGRRHQGYRWYPPSEDVRGGWYDKGTNTQPPPPPPPPPAPPPPLRPVPPTNLRIKSGVIPTAEEVLTRRPPEVK